MDTPDSQLIHHRLGIGVWRTSRDGQSVIVKATASSQSEFIAALRREYELLRQLNVPGVVRVHEFNRVSQGVGIVMDDAGPQTLADRLRAGPLPIHVFLDLAIQLTDTLGRLHAARFVHRDLNPANIVLAAAADRATIIDFDRATVDSSAALDGGLSEGDRNYAYISPEQTGRTGHAVDLRTDLYSLGAVFYEMLTGIRPFPSNNPAELVHAHIAIVPQAPHEFDLAVPPILSNIVLKLLEKEPQQRYQTPLAVALDLREARRRWKQTGAIASFALAIHDMSRELVLPQTLYGRTEHLRTLQDAFNRACQGGREVVLVTGAPGIGKSALVDRLSHDVAKRHGIYVSGKFEQLQRSVPFGGLGQAFAALARHLLTQPESLLATWRKRIQDAVGPNGQVVIEVVPEFGAILGQQPPLPESGPVETKNRFHLVFTRLLRLVAQPEHPLVLFLDDLQWVDAASLELLEHWIGDTTIRHLLLIGTYRDTEVESSHRLAIALEGIRSADRVPHRIHLGPLQLNDIARLTADAFNSDSQKTRALSEVIARKTGGNPFFIRRLLHLLHSDGLVVFVPESLTWEWDLQELQRTAVTENVLDLMAEAIQRLPEATRQLLHVAACIGYRFDFDTLAAVSGQPALNLARELAPALDDGLLVSARDSAGTPRRSRMLDEGADGGPKVVQFVHDRVQQAAYSLLDEKRRRALHLEIGRRLLRTTDATSLDERIFEIVDQINLGADLIVDPAEHLRVVELNLAAGRKATASAAYQAAFDYLRMAMRHLPERPWTREAALTFAIHRALAECAYLTGQHDKAEELIDTALEHAPTQVAKADLYALRALAATVAGDMSAALHWGREGLAVFGHAWPHEDLAAANQAEASAVMANLGGRNITALVHEPEVVNEETRACMQLLSILGPPAYFFGADVLTFVVTRAANLSLLHGPSKYSAYAYVFYGALHNARTGDYDIGYAFGELALALARRFGDRAEQSRTLEVFGLVVHPWKVPLRDSLPLVREGFRAGVESGELAYAAFNLNSVLINGLPAGLPLTELLSDANSAIEFATWHKNRTCIELSIPFRQIARALTGETSTASSFDDDIFKERQFLEDAKNNQTALGFYWVARLQAAYLDGDYSTALQCAREAERHIAAGNLGMITNAEHVFYTALTLTAVGQSFVVATPLEELDSLHHRLLDWAKHCPQNFSHKAALVGAEMARLRGDAYQAMKLYKTAIDEAAREAFTQDEALAHELRGRFLLRENEGELAAVHLRAARTRYQEWGAVAKVRSLERDHPELLAPLRGLTRTEDAIDALALVQAAHAMSLEPVPERLFGRMLQVALQAGGAQNGALIQCDVDGLTVRSSIGMAVEEPSSVPLSIDDCAAIPAAIIRYVLRVKEPVLLASAMSRGPFVSDPVVQRRQLQSVLCVPLKTQANVVGVLYLENETLPNAFTTDLLKIVEVLASQAAISLENNLLTERSNQQRRLYETILASTPDFVYVFGLDKRFTYLNPALLATWGQTWDTAVGRRLIELGYEPWHAEMHEREIEQVVSTKLPVRGEVPFTGTAGRRIYDYIFVPVFDASGDVEAVAGTSRDITERKQSEDALRNSEQRLGEANRAKDEFLAMLGHELRNPLAPIRTALHLMRLRGETTTERERQIIERQVEHMRSLVDDLLDVSRITSGKIRLECAPVEIADVVARAIETASPLLEQKKHEVQVDILSRGLVVNADIGRLAQAIANLLNNAAKYTETGGQIDISASTVENDVVIRVSDSGTGITNEMLPRVFDLFSQGRQSLDRAQGGLGLGLAIVKSVVTLHGGSVEASSEGVGRGAQFCIKLPRMSVPVRIPIDDAIDDVFQQAERVRRVLIVDDNTDAAAMLQAVLEAYGHVVETAGDGLEGLRVAREFRPDVALLDIGLPVMDGYEVAKRFASDADLRHVRMVAVTGYGQEQDRQRSRELGFVAHLVKPIRVDELREVIESVTDQAPN